MRANVADATGLSFACQPGCGFCCTANPLVQPAEAGPLGALVVRAQDGALRIPLKGVACGALGDDRACGAYAERPSVCHLYPYQVHAGRRIQVTVSLACPGVVAGEGADEGAQEAAALALAQPGAADMAARAKDTFAEFDRRMKEWGAHATPDRLRAAFLPHAAALATPASLPAFFAALAPGDLLLEGRAASAVEALFDAEPSADLFDLFEEASREAFGENRDVLWIEPDLAWTTARSDGRHVHLTRHRAGASPQARETSVHELPVDWTVDATAVVADYLARLMHRDHAEGAAAWLVDASGYQATPAAAYARVLGEASLHVALRAALLAAEDGHEAVDAAHARRGVAAYETAFHSLPTLGSVL